MIYIFISDDSGVTSIGPIDYIKKLLILCDC